MRTPSLLALLAITPSTLAQTWPGFVPHIPRTLVLEFGGHNVSRGELFEDLEDVRFQPRIQIGPTDPIMHTQGHWLVIMFDSDAPIHGTRINYLHWIADADRAEIGADNLLQPVSRGEVTYTPPRPPAGDSPHRYSVLLYDRPANFSLARTMANTDWDSYRVGFDVEEFLRASGLTLGLGATYFRVADPLPSRQQMPDFPPSAYEMGSKAEGSDAWWSESGGTRFRGGLCALLLPMGVAMFMLY